MERVGDDGLPLVRYGFVGDVNADEVLVMLDGELASASVDLAQLRPVTMTNIELCLHGADLLTRPELRRGLVGLWQAEADEAGLAVDGLQAIGDGLADTNHSWALAEVHACGDRYVIRAVQQPHEPGVVRVRAERPALS
jgi:hypothetical protein